jgi:sugar lactone lactonase YvrE
MWILGAAALAVVLLATPGTAQVRKVYFTETQFGPPPQYKVDVDGSNKETFDIIPVADFLPQGIVFSPDHTQLYYCNQNGGIGSVMRINADGTGRTFLVSGLQDARGIEADFANNHLYFVDRVFSILYRVNTDGTGVTPLLFGGSERIERLALDLTNGKIYFGNSTAKSIERCDLDGSNRETVFSSDVNNPAGICLDVDAQKLYWVDAASATNYVARVNTDGTGFEILYDGPQEASGLIDIDIDPISQHIYWVDAVGTGQRGFWMASTDGSGVRRFHATGSSNGLTPTTILVQDEPGGVLPCTVGNVNAGAGEITDILFVNGSAGGSDRTVTVQDGVEITASIVKPPAGGRGRYVIHGNLGFPDASNVTPLPRNIGDTCWPILLSDGATPVIVANAARNDDRVGASNFFGEATPNPTRAPATLFARTSDPNLAPGTVVSLQGAIFDPGSAAPRGVSVTNLVTFVVE